MNSSADEGQTERGDFNEVQTGRGTSVIFAVARLIILSRPLIALSGYDLILLVINEIVSECFALPVYLMRSKWREFMLITRIVRSSLCHYHPSSPLNGHSRATIANDLLASTNAGKPSNPWLTHPDRTTTRRGMRAWLWR